VIKIALWWPTTHATHSNTPYVSTHAYYDIVVWPLTNANYGNHLHSAQTEH
jgi:hypothetical protein